MNGQDKGASADADRATAAAQSNPQAVSSGAGIPSALRFLEDAAVYFEGRKTGGEDRAYWANVFNAANCRAIATLIRRQNFALSEIISAHADAVDVFPDWKSCALAMAEIADAAHEDAEGNAP